MPKRSKQPPAQQATEQPTPSPIAGQPTAGQLSLPFEVMSALLGGAEAGQVIVDPSASSGFVAVLDSSRAYLSPGIGAAEPGAGVMRQFALEIASLKVRCFDALVRMLIGRSHAGGLAVQRVTGLMREQLGALMPARWSIEVVVHDEPGDDAADNLARDLGNLFALLLLANDSRNPEQVQQLVATTADEFTTAANNTPSATAEQLHELAATVLSRSPMGNSNEIIHAANIRSRAGTTLPRSIWRTATKLILRLQTNIAGFSLGKAPLLDLHGELTALGKTLDIATFGAMARRDEIAAVVRNQLDKLGQGS